MKSSVPWHRHVSLQPRINQTPPQITHLLHFCLANSTLNYPADYVVNWIEVMVVRRPQIWRDELVRTDPPFRGSAIPGVRVRVRVNPSGPPEWRTGIELVAVGFAQPLGTASLQTLQTEIAVYDTHYGGHREIPDSVITWRVERQVCGRPSWLSVSSSIAATVSSTCVLTSV